MASFMSYLFGATDSNAANKTVGENGAPLMETADHPGVTAFNKMVRDHRMNHKTGKEAKKATGSSDMELSDTRESIAKYVRDMVQTGERNVIEQNNHELLADTFLLCAHKRATTRNGGSSSSASKAAGGEGERMIYYQMVLELFKYYPVTTLELVKMSPTFGYWLDLYQIWELLCWRLANGHATLTGDGYDYMVLIHGIVHCIYEQLVADFEKAEGNNHSQLCKWFAREGAYYDQHCYIPGTSPHLTSNTLFAKLVGYYYTDKNAKPDTWLTDIITGKVAIRPPVMNNYRAQLRRRVAQINKAMDTFETHACAHDWASIKPEMVPSRCMLKNTKALLNEKLKGAVTSAEEETGNRYPDDEDRVQARKNLLTMLTDPSKIKTAGVDPHEIMKAHTSGASSAQKAVANAQWTQKVAEVMDQMRELREKLIAEGQTIPEHVGNLLPMMDVSGSMSGLPMDVSIGLGLFLTYIQEAQGKPPVAISFTESPRVFDFTGKTLAERHNMVSQNVGYTTNFEAALDLVLDCIKKSGEHRDLIVFTDGQFNDMHRPNQYQYGHHANTSWTTSHERFLQKVAELGLARAPRIIYWNLRCDTPGVQTSASHPGVQMLQGYSPALLRFVLLGDSVKETQVEVLNTVTGQMQKVAVSTVTPYDTYRQALDFDRWDPIRNMLSNSVEKHLVGYGWTRV
jgi:hypothetical protein